MIYHICLNKFNKSKKYILLFYFTMNSYFLYIFTENMPLNSKRDICTPKLTKVEKHWFKLDKWHIYLLQLLFSSFKSPNIIAVIWLPLACKLFPISENFLNSLLVSWSFLSSYLTVHGLSWRPTSYFYQMAAYCARTGKKND